MSQDAKSRFFTEMEEGMEPMEQLRQGIRELHEQLVTVAKEVSSLRLEVSEGLHARQMETQRLAERVAIAEAWQKQHEKQCEQRSKGISVWAVMLVSVSISGVFTLLSVWLTRK